MLVLGGDVAAAAMEERLARAIDDRRRSSARRSCRGNKCSMAVSLFLWVCAHWELRMRSLCGAVLVQALCCIARSQVLGYTWARRRIQASRVLFDAESACFVHTLIRTSPRPPFDRDTATSKDERAGSVRGWLGRGGGRRSCWWV